MSPPSLTSSNDNGGFSAISHCYFLIKTFAIQGHTLGKLCIVTQKVKKVSS